MKTIKNAFNTAINFLAKWFNKGVTLVTNQTLPLIANLCGTSDEPLSTEMVGKFALGLAGYVVALIAVAYLSVLFMTGLTLLLALVLPVLAANLIACGLTITLIFLIGNRAETIRDEATRAAVVAA